MKNKKKIIGLIVAILILGGGITGSVLLFNAGIKSNKIVEKATQKVSALTELNNTLDELNEDLRKVAINMRFEGSKKGITERYNELEKIREDIYKQISDTKTKITSLDKYQKIINDNKTSLYYILASGTLIISILGSGSLFIYSKKAFLKK